MANVITLPTAATVPVKNPKTHGRPKGTISLAMERREREDQKLLKAVESPYHPSVEYPQPVRKGIFHYPKELLLQGYNCRSGHGVWHEPRLTLSHLADEGFISPLNSLLCQLEAEGHDVKAARLEWRALRETSSHLNDLGMKLILGPPCQACDGETWDFDEEPQPVA